MSNPFFKNKGPFLILNILDFLEIKNVFVKTNIEIRDIKDLYSSNNSEGKKNNRIIIYYNESSQHYQTIIRDKFINSISINNFIEIVE